ncbi:MAG: KEOPS complex subunit [Hadesarchaea archaeon]|nr:KEOPS complex subunit [Hadesarchaea archaeon]
MSLKAEVSCSYENESSAKAISSSLEPDNLQAPENVEISTHRDGKDVVTKVTVEGRIETLLATLEDLLSCASTAEKVID